MAHIAFDGWKTTYQYLLCGGHQGANANCFAAPRKQSNPSTFHPEKIQDPKNHHAQKTMKNPWVAHGITNLGEKYL